MVEPVTLEAPAKVNLFLRILAREQDGYHGIETLYCRLTLADRVTASLREGAGEAVTLEVRGGADTGPPLDNLAVRAAQAVLAAVRGDRRCPVHLVLDKLIPVQAGLGGGSSDAAATLLAVNQLLGQPVPQHELFQIASRLGADVPFFLSGASLALAWGHGDRLFRLSPLPPAPVLLLIPPTGVATREAYQWVDEGRLQTSGGRGALALDPEALSSWGSVGRMSGNDFETAVFGHRPPVRVAYETLARTHPVVCRLSGSGSALCAVYRTSAQRDDALAMLGKKHGRVVATTTA